MKLVLVLLPFVALASAQFGFGGGLGNVANNFRQRITDIASTIPSPPVLTNVQNFGDFVVSSQYVQLLRVPSVICNQLLGRHNQASPISRRQIANCVRESSVLVKV